MDRAIAIYKEFFEGKKLITHFYGMRDDEFNAYIQTLDFKTAEGSNTYFWHKKNFIFVKAGTVRVLNNKSWDDRKECISELKLMKGVAKAAEIIFVPVGFDFVRSLKNGRHVPFTGEDNKPLNNHEAHAAMIIIDVPAKKMVFIDGRMLKREFVHNHKPAKFACQSIRPGIIRAWGMNGFKWKTHKLLNGISIENGCPLPGLHAVKKVMETNCDIHALPDYSIPTGKAWNKRKNKVVPPNTYVTDGLLRIRNEVIDNCAFYGYYVGGDWETRRDMERALCKKL